LISFFSVLWGKEIQDRCQKQLSLKYGYIFLNYIIKPTTFISRIPDVYMWTQKCHTNDFCDPYTPRTRRPPIWSTPVTKIWKLTEN